VDRLAGPDRYSTAREIADEVIAVLGAAYDGGAFVATGGNFPDALAASPLAAFLGRPILLAQSTGAPSMPDAVRSVVILGGTSAVSSSTQDALEDALGFSNVSRVAGSTRYDTGALLAQWGTTWGMHWNEVAIATGEAFPDGLSGGAAAGQRGSVMLLTPSASLANEAKGKLVENADEICEVHFIGGTSAVSDSVRTSVKNAVD
jgi:putative cell wall-binding protein